VKCFGCGSIRQCLGHRLSLLRTFFKNIADRFAANDPRCPGADLHWTRCKQHIDPAAEPTRLKKL
jgi:hypothetical protein